MQSPTRKSVLAAGTEDRDAPVSEYLTVSEAAELLRIAPRTLRNKMSHGLFRLGEHYIRPRGLGTRFKRGSLLRWLEGTADVQSDGKLLADIPMSRGRLIGSDGR